LDSGWAIVAWLGVLVGGWLDPGTLAAEAPRAEGTEAAAPPEAPKDRWTLDVGSQIRLRGDFTRNQSLTDFGFAPGRREAQFLQRSRLNVSAEDTVLGLKAFAQGQWYGRWGGTDHRSDVDLYQGYIEWEKVLGSPLSLKAGRQEFVYGSAFFLGANDFYNGFSWDGLKATLAPHEGIAVDLLGARMAKLNPGDPDIYLAGVHGTVPVYEGGALDGYLFHNRGGFPLMHREFELIDSGQRWYTAGLRFAGKLGGFDYEVEPQYQWGRVKAALGDGKDRVRAYGGHLDVGYTFKKLPWEPRVFGAYAFGSGHNDITKGKYGEFHGNIFNDNYLVGDMSVIPDLSGLTVDGIHASGMQVWVAGICVNPLASLNLNLDVHRFRAREVPDTFSKDVGLEANLVGTYKPTKWLSFTVGLNRLFAGRFLEQAGGSKRNIDYVYIQTQVEF
jgi:alginate export protein